MLFLEKDIDRLMMLEEEDRLSILERIKAWSWNQQGDEGDEDDEESADTELVQLETETEE